MKTSKLISFVVSAVLVAALFQAGVVAAPGDLIKNVNLPVPGTGVSVAVDCQGNIYYTVANDNNLYKMDHNGNLLATVPIVDAAGAPLLIDEMAFQNSGGAGTLWGQLHSSNPVDVYTIDPTTGFATFAFTSMTNSAGTYRDGIAYDGTDSTIWISGDVSSTIEHYMSDGTFINQITPKDSLGGTLGYISGVQVGVGDMLYLGQNGLVKIVQVKKSNGDWIAEFASPGGARDEGLECDPVNFAPKLALWSREFNSPGFVSAIEIEPGTCGCGGEPEVTRVAVDIKPQSCPNPLNVKPFQSFDLTGEGDEELATAARLVVPLGPPPAKAVLPAAILGTMDFDVADIDVATVMLAGVSPDRWAIEDVSTPIPADADSCECNTLGGDGWNDLTLKFNKQAIIAAIGPVADGDVIPLVLTGMLLDGTQIEGYDCVIIRGPKHLLATSAGGDFGLNNHPNPFNPTTEITFNLPTAGHVTLEVFNVAGQRITTLIDEPMAVGAHAVQWNGRNESGHTVSSGVYFYRLAFGGLAQSKKMLLMK